ncbi:uncharacterized protein LOC119921770 [Tachyglossus aculeatus]|uniref:uncharacterized protein LOC119921770 n=1 Tax=Tachyglossus aculeatus TaxID=9261 RepID=UPI0018F4E674|nr:uncharacterized protein LOC119921770 [Tachyglossus aculeatus]
MTSKRRRMMHFPHCFRKKYLKREMTRRALTSKTARMKWQRLEHRVTENDNFRNVKNSQKEERNFQKEGSRPSKRMEMGIKMYIALMRRRNHQLRTSITSMIVFLTVKPVSCRWRKQSSPSTMGPFPWTFLVLGYLLSGLRRGAFQSPVPAMTPNEEELVLPLNRSFSLWCTGDSEISWRFPTLDDESSGVSIRGEKNNCSNFLSVLEVANASAVHTGLYTCYYNDTQAQGTGIIGRNIYVYVPEADHGFHPGALEGEICGWGLDRPPYRNGGGLFCQ